MKMYKTVLSAVEEDNYKRGVTRLDTSSGYYNASKKLNIFATIWLMLFQFAFLFGNTTALLIYTKNAKNVDMPLYFVTLVAFFVVGASLYLIRKKTSYRRAGS